VSRGAAARLAWAGCALAIALTLGALVFLILNRSTPDTGTFGSRVGDALLGLALLTFPTVGALVGSRRPENPIGWIFIGLGTALAVVAFANQYAAYALETAPGSLPAGMTMAWLGSWLFLAPLFLTGTLVCLLFPDGRLLSRRWRPLLWASVGAVVLAAIGEMFIPGPLEDFDSLQNPYAADGGLAGAFEVIANVGFVLLLVSLASVASLVVRFRRARGLERQQLKWVAAAAGLVGAAFLSGPALFWWLGDVGDVAWQTAILFAIAAIPVATGVAILRYRLYEIDRIVNRAVVYGAVTALLAGAYFGIVLGLQEVFSSFGGGSDLAIAISTLAVAALFRPLRARVQAAVDRRFYRRRYDAQRTLEAFSAHLRDEIDVTALNGELSRIAQRTMQPAHVSVWLRPTVTEAVTLSGRGEGRSEGDR
jgi:hypothetical protein